MRDFIVRMRWVSLAGLLACGLAACEPVTTQQATQTATTVIDAAKAIRTQVVQKCSWEPALAGLVTLFSKSYGQTFDSIATAVCDAASSIPLADGGKRDVIVKGVRLKGKRIVTFLK